MSEEENNNVPVLDNMGANKKRSKKRDFNDYSLVTNLIIKYKKTQDEHELLEIIRALEGIINSFTIIMCPGDNSQQIYLNPYMKKFLGMFLSKDERSANTPYMTFMQAVYRIRWIMRFWTYEDMYSYIVSVIIDIVKKMKVITTDGKTCDCIYYIQLVAKFKMHTLVLKTAKDIMVDIKEMPTDFNSQIKNDGYEDTLERLTFDPDSVFYEDKLISSLYNEIDISILLKDEDVFKCFSPYEKYIIYLYDYIGLTAKQISSILKHESPEDIEERIGDIIYKLKLLAE